MLTLSSVPIEDFSRRPIKRIGMVLLLSSPLAAIFGWNFYAWNLERYHGTYCYLKDEDSYVYIQREDMLDGILALDIRGTSYLYDADGRRVLDEKGMPQPGPAISRQRALELARQVRQENPGRYDAPRYMMAVRNPSVYWRSFSFPYGRQFEYHGDHYYEACAIYRALTD